MSSVFNERIALKTQIKLDDLIVVNVVASPFNVHARLIKK